MGSKNYETKRKAQMMLVNGGEKYLAYMLSEFDKCKNGTELKRLMAHNIGLISFDAYYLVIIKSLKKSRNEFEDAIYFHCDSAIENFSLSQINEINNYINTYYQITPDNEKKCFSDFKELIDERYQVIKGVGVQGLQKPQNDETAPDDGKPGAR